MPERKTLDEVKKIIYEKTNGDIKILSDKYINSTTPLKIMCKCGNIFERDFNHLNKGRFYCINCSHEKQVEHSRISLDDVKRQISELGCEYISGEYKNCESKLLIRCSCGNTFYKSLHKLKCGQNRCPDCGRLSFVKLNTKYDKDSAKKILLEHGYTMIGDYINAGTEIKCLCRRNHECDIILSQLLVHRSGCAMCAIIDHSGENHHNYHGGISPISEVIRERIKPWKSEVRNLYKRCPLTGEYGLKADVHHLLSFDYIFNSCIKELNIDINSFSMINEIESSELFNNLIDKILEKHTLTSGILISKQVHKQFHSEYGYGNNTPEQFNEFLIKHYSITLDNVLITQ